MTQSERTTHARRGLVRLVAVGVVSLALGVGATAALGARQPAPEAAPPTSTLPDDSVTTAPAVAAEPIAAPGGRAATPEDAVAQFLAAEQRGEFPASFAHLTPDNQDAVGRPAQWVAAHAQIPVVTGWRLEDVRADRDTAEVDGTLALQPELDEVAGLVPGSAAATWRLERVGNEWFVDFDGSLLAPQYPPDATADDAVVAWLASRQACDSAPEEYDGGLVGQPALAESLCEATGDPSVGDARPLETAEVDALLPPFGAEAEIWARAVDVTAPVPLRALVAPLGDTWIVVGVLQA